MQASASEFALVALHGSWGFFIWVKIMNNILKSIEQERWGIEPLEVLVNPDDPMVYKGHMQYNYDAELHNESLGRIAEAATAHEQASKGLYEALGTAFRWLADDVPCRTKGDIEQAFKQYEKLMEAK